ncbi:tetratricopeptide repeat protein [Candidatus Poribacteria bacterium]|nr:tetratricopeptide repeat protein [Candidatus Poribacteria bacterium]
MPNPREELIREALAAEPDDPLVHFVAGTFYAEEGRHEEALEAFSSAVRLNPDYSAARLGLARAYAALGEDDAAREAYRAASEVARAKGDLKVRNEADAELDALDEF